MDNINIGIIGCGNMGSAIASGIISMNITEDNSLFVFDKIVDKSNYLAEKNKCSICSQDDLIKKADYIILSVKPQDFDSLVGEIGQKLDGQTIISIMAGVSICTIKEKLHKVSQIFRVMPNMPADICESISCIASDEAADEKKLEFVKKIFSGIGKVIETEEKFMDAITAISGSGPAYLFYLAEAMISAAKQQDMDDEMAKKLVFQTLYGAAKYLREKDADPSKLIQKVASKGGTTEAALSVFAEKECGAIIVEAIKKAKLRSEEISKGE